MRNRLARIGDVAADAAAVTAVRALVVGSATGVVGGLGTFMVGNGEAFPLPESAWLALVPVALAGLYTHWLARDLRESFAAASVAFVVGCLVCIGAWLYPVYAMGYTGFLAELAGAPRLRDAVVDVFSVYLLLFGASYLAAITIDGLRE